MKKPLLYHIAGVTAILDYSARVYVVTLLAADIWFNLPLAGRDLSCALLLVVLLQWRAAEQRKPVQVTLELPTQGETAKP